MPANRFYVSRIGADLSKDEMHHISKVMRVRDEEIIELVDGCGNLASARFGQPLEILETSHASPPPELILLQAIPKLQKLELIIEKGTELGVTTFHLFPSIRSELKTLSENKLGRLIQITIAALKQSGRLYLPKIILSNALPTITLPTYHGDPLAKNRLCAKAPLAIAIGPESGFTKEEMQNLGEPVLLHTNTLRCETAAIAALSQVW